jgi:predicted nucleotide-binding protein (sugar kinase/HSP70/actin superfamily)
MEKSVEDLLDLERDVDVEEMLNHCGPYVHRDYDGDPALALGTAAALADSGIAGVVNILPFTCMPGTLISAVAPSFRKDHENIPWINIDYDGQDLSSLTTRLQAFTFQAVEYADTHGLRLHNWRPTRSSATIAALSSP